MVKSKPVSKVLITTILLIMVFFCIFSSVFIKTDTLWVAVIIALISLFGFHLIAFYTFECLIYWKYVDYPWVLIAFMTIIIGITTIQENYRSESFNKSSNERLNSYNEFLYSLKTVTVNECDSRLAKRPGWIVSPEPYKGACARLIHFSIQIEQNSFKRISTDVLDTDQMWMRNIRAGLESAKGSWSGLDLAAKSFSEKIEELKKPVGLYELSKTNFIVMWARSESFKYWYYLLAFLLGMRLSKITAEIFATNKLDTIKIALSLNKIVNRLKQFILKPFIWIKRLRKVRKIP